APPARVRADFRRVGCRADLDTPNRRRRIGSPTRRRRRRARTRHRRLARNPWCSCRAAVPFRMAPFLAKNRTESKRSAGATERRNRKAAGAQRPTVPKPSRSTFIAAGAAFAVAPAAVRAQTLEKIRLSAVPTDDMTPVYWGLKSGVFRKAGVDLE